MVVIVKPLDPRCLAYFAPFVMLREDTGVSCHLEWPVEDGIRNPSHCSLTIVYSRNCVASKGIRGFLRKCLKSTYSDDFSRLFAWKSDYPKGCFAKVATTTEFSDVFLDKTRESFQ